LPLKTPAPLYICTSIKQYNHLTFGGTPLSNRKEHHLQPTTKCSSEPPMPPLADHEQKESAEEEPTRKSDDGLEDDVSKGIVEPKPHRHPSRRPIPGFHPRPYGMGDEQDDATEGENSADRHSHHQH
jgi:hypothetical protein